MVDMYAKIEQRLNYIKMNQQQSRSDLYRGLVDAVNSGKQTPKRLVAKLFNTSITYNRFNTYYTYIT